MIGPLTVADRQPTTGHREMATSRPEWRPGMLPRPGLAGPSAPSELSRFPELQALPSSSFAAAPTRRMLLQPPSGERVFEAAASGDAAAVLSLARAGAPLSDRCGEADWTPLIAAAASGHREVVKVLADAGADLSARSTAGGVAAAAVATQRGHSSIVSLLAGRGADLTGSFWVACATGAVPIARMLVSHGADTGATVSTRLCIPDSSLAAVPLH